MLHLCIGTGGAAGADDVGECTLAIAQQDASAAIEARPRRDAFAGMHGRRFA